MLKERLLKAHRNMNSSGRDRRVFRWKTSCEEVRFNKIASMFNKKILRLFEYIKSSQSLIIYLSVGPDRTNLMLDL